MTNCTCGDCPECRPPGRILEDTDGEYDAYDVLAQQRAEDLNEELRGIARSQDRKWSEDEFLDWLDKV